MQYSEYKVPSECHEVAKALLGSQNVLIVPHINIDGDDLGSMVACAEVLKQLHKSCYLYSPDGTPEIEKLTTALITYSNPKMFTGSDGVEIQFDRQFENLCLVLSEQLHVEPKKYSVLEFYNAFDFVKERAKQAEKAQKRAKFKR